MITCFFKSKSSLWALSSLLFWGMLLYPLPGAAFYKIETPERVILFSQKNGDLLAVGPKGMVLSPAFGREAAPLAPIIGLSLPDGHALKGAFEALTFQLEKEEESETSHTLLFTSGPLASGLSFKKVYVIRKGAPFLELSFSSIGTGKAPAFDMASLQLTLNPSGAGDLSEKGKASERRVLFVGGGESLTGEEFKERSSSVVEKGAWAGFRNRFFAVLIKPEAPLTWMGEKRDPASPDSLTLTFKSDSSLTPISVTLYAGPVDWFSFGKERETLLPLLYDALWFWVRWISFGLFFVLYGLIQATGSPGIAIILLSLSVKITMLPLVRLSDSWQTDVNRKNALLEPRLKQIKSSHKGREQHQKILDLHKELGIHPMYALKNFLGCFIQIPIFFAAYHTLSETVWLNGVSFLWIRDLAYPDRFMTLPFDLFYFGGHLNLFPLLMTAITVATAALFQDPLLTPSQLKKQKMNLYVMAAAFLILFYPFPAGMVLYWTMNNLWALIKEVGRKMVNPRYRGSMIWK